MSSRDPFERPRVLVVGPFSALGGMGTVCRSMLTGELIRRWDIRPFDNTKRTPPDRALWHAVAAHFGLLLALALRIIRHPPRLVHVHTCSYTTFYRSALDVLLARLLLRPVVLHIHGGYFERFLGTRRGVERWLVRGILRLADRVVVLGETWRQTLAPWVPPERLAIVPNGVSVPPRGRCGHQRKPLRIVGVGDLGPGKGAQDLIEALTRLPGALRARLHVEWIGDGPPAQRQHLTRLLSDRRMQSCFRLMGTLSPERVQSRLHHADLFVLPSHGEGLPLALLEAMAWGVPPLVTRVGAVPEVVRNGREGLLFPPGDAAALADGLRRLLTDASLRARLGRQARQRILDAYSLPRFHTALEHLWAECAKPSRFALRPSWPATHHSV